MGPVWALTAPSLVFAVYYFPADFSAQMLLHMSIMFTSPSIIAVALQYLTMLTANMNLKIIIATELGFLSLKM